MSDFKDRFRAAAAQRGSSVPTKEQIRALKASRKEIPQVAAEKPAPRSSNEQPAMAVELCRRAKALPEEFFQEPATKKQVSTSVVQPSPASAPSNAAVAKSSSTSGPNATLPMGFFADKAADAKARGEKIPDQKDKEEDFKQFQRLMDEQIKDLVTKEAEEAEKDAEDREDREAFEQRMRLQHMEDIRQRRIAEAAPMSSSLEGEETFRISLPARKRKVAVVVHEQLHGDEDGNESGDDTDGGDELVLDWRAKGVQM